MPITPQAFRRLGAGLFAISLAVAVPAAQAAPEASPLTKLAYGPSERPLGRTHTDWLARWSRWAMETPSATNPLLTLEKCDRWSQPEPKRAFYLSAGGPGSFTTSCTVSARLPIALTPGGYFGWEKPEKTAVVDAQIGSFAQGVRNPKVTVDGVNIDPRPYLVEMPKFGPTKVVAPELGPPQGDALFRAKGWMMVLTPMSKGRHTVTIYDELVKRDDKGDIVLENGQPAWLPSTVTFELKVV